VAKEDRGFASMDRSKQREIASKGGKAAHQKGTAHEWTSEEAREAGRKGGMASHRRKQQGDAPAEEPQAIINQAMQMPQWPRRDAADSMEGEPTAPDESQEPMPRGEFGRGNFGDDDIR
jgi:general stress protein YciG